MRWREQKIKQSLACFLSIILFCAIVYPLASIQWTEQQTKPINVSVIQGNIPQLLKWSPEAFQQSLDTYQKLTEQHWQSQLIVWPEAAIAMPSAYMQDYLSALSQQARKHHTTLITGIPVDADQADHYYNGMIAIGDGSGQYYKRQLVPFGEYVPMENWLRGIFNAFNLPMSTIIPGPKQQANLYSNSLHLQIAPFICYEIAYPNIVLDALPDAQLLVTISDDAWFGDSLAPAQHLQIAQMRSLQTGRYQVTSTNNGISAIINPQGQIIARLPQFERGVLTGTVFAMTGATPWVHMGYTPILMCMFAMLFLAFLLRNRNQQMVRLKNYGLEASE